MRLPSQVQLCSKSASAKVVFDGCVHARTCSASWPQLSQCPCLAKTKRAAEQAAASLIITGAIDGPLPGSLPKVVELYAVEGGSLAPFGLGVAVNGGGGNGAQAEFPSDATVAKGKFILVATTSGVLELMGK